MDDVAGIADALFDARRAMAAAEERLDNALLNLPDYGCTGNFDGNQYGGYHFDDYDSSIEFKDCENDWRLTPDNQSLLWRIGFSRCWLNHKNGSETYYDKAAPGEAYRKAVGIKARIKAARDAQC